MDKKTMINCFYAADILLPDFDKTCGSKWATIACDQFTSEREYWEAVEETVGGAPSTLSLMIPEVYLDQTEQRLPAIHNAMKRYEEKILVNAVCKGAKLSDLTKEDAVLSLMFSRQITSDDDSMMLDLIDGTLEKVKGMADAEWDKIKMLVPFEVVMADEVAV